MRGGPARPCGGAGRPRTAEPAARPGRRRRVRLAVGALGTAGACHPARLPRPMIRAIRRGLRHGRGGTVIVWVNGAFGAGKTSAARELIDLIPDSTLYDPELIGGGLRLTAAAEAAGRGHRLPGPARSGGGWWSTPPPRCSPRWAGLARGADDAAAAGVPRRDLRRARRPRGSRCGMCCSHPRKRSCASGSPARGHARTTPEASERVRALVPGPPRAATGRRCRWLTADAHVVDTSGPDPAADRRADRRGGRTGRRAPATSCRPPSRPPRPSPPGCCSSTSTTGCCSSTPPTSPAGSSPAESSSRARRRPAPGMREVAEETGHTARPACPGCWSSTGSRRSRPATAACGCSSTAAGCRRADAGRLLLPGAELRGWRFVTEDGGRRPAAAGPATTGCAGRCGPASRAAGSTWRPGVPRRLTAASGAAADRRRRHGRRAAPGPAPCPACSRPLVRRAAVPAFAGRA